MRKQNTRIKTPQVICAETLHKKKNMKTTVLLARNQFTRTISNKEMYSTTKQFSQI